MSGVRVLDPKRISDEVERMIDEADEFLILVSPFARLWEDVEDAIIAAHQHDVDTTMVVCKDRHVSRELLKEKVNVVVAPSVHAKIYVSEQEAILTSFNLTSEAENSLECGVLLPRAGARDAYEEALRQARAAVEAGERATGSTSRGRGRGRDSGRGGRDAPRDAFCISCGDALRFDPDRPQCRKCFDDGAGGGRCHQCGKEERTDRRRPLCRECFSA